MSTSASSSASLLSRDGALLTYDGANFLRARLVLATLRGRAVRVRRVRERHADPGLREHEASLVRLLDKVTNGSK